MSELNSQIIVEGRRDATVKLTLRDPRSGRLVTTGIVAGPRQRDIDAQVVKIRDQLERAGHRVNVVCR